MIENSYQEMLAERSLVVDIDNAGEYWQFRWYIDPLSNGMAEWIQFSVIIEEGESVILSCARPILTETEELAQEQAGKFVKNRLAQQELIS